jgi:hypothetical protein
MFTKLLSLAVVLFTIPASAGGFNQPPTFRDTHEVVTPAEADEARVLEVMLTHSEELRAKRTTLHIESVHLHTDHASVYLSTDSGESYGTWLVDMEGRW